MYTSVRTVPGCAVLLCQRVPHFPDFVTELENQCHFISRHSNLPTAIKFPELCKRKTISVISLPLWFRSVMETFPNTVIFTQTTTTLRNDLAITARQGLDISIFLPQYDPCNMADSAKKGKSLWRLWTNTIFCAVWQAREGHGGPWPQWAAIGEDGALLCFKWLLGGKSAIVRCVSSPTPVAGRGGSYWFCQTGVSFGLCLFFVSVSRILNWGSSGVMGFERPLVSDFSSLGKHFSLCIFYGVCSQPPERLPFEKSCLFVILLLLLKERLF